jgi:P27 family predicted phage terminase small subunit
VPPAGAPKCSSDLSKDAKREWKRIGPDLMDMGVLSRIDTAALAAYCECCSRWRDAERNIAKYGSVIRTPSGYPIQSPYIGIATKAIEQMRKILQRVPHDAGIAQPPQCLASPGQGRNKRSLRIPRVIWLSLTRELYGPKKGYIKALDLRNSHLGRCVPSVCTQTTQQTGQPVLKFAWQRIILMILQRQKRGRCASQ